MRPWLISTFVCAAIIPASPASAKASDFSERAMVQSELSSSTTYDEATDCSIVLMETGVDPKKAASLEDLRSYAREVATWQIIRSRKAKEEGREITDLSAEIYCDVLSIGCEAEGHIQTVLKDCRAKYKAAHKAVKKRKAK